MSNNKFIKQYPAFWEPEVGDKIKVIKVLNPFHEKGFGWFNILSDIRYYQIGDTGTIIGEDRYCYKLYFPRYKTNFWVYKEEMEPI